MPTIYKSNLVLPPRSWIFFVWIMELRRRLTYEIRGQPLLQKAVALAILIKLRTGKTSTLHNFTVNKLHLLTGLSATTINKYLPVMQEMNLISFQGAKKDVLVVHRLHSKTKHRNISIDLFKKNNFKSVYNSLRSFLFLLIQAKKDAVKRLFQSISEPKSIKELKAAKSTCRHFVSLNIIKGNEYKEYGLSFKKIANVVGCCVRTAQNVVNYAIKNKWSSKHNHYEKVFMPNVCYLDIDGYTFTTKNYGYIYYPNTYTLSPRVTKQLNCMVTIVGKK